jgi:hypothetical protein
MMMMMWACSSGTETKTSNASSDWPHSATEIKSFNKEKEKSIDLSTNSTHSNVLCEQGLWFDVSLCALQTYARGEISPIDSLQLATLRSRKIQ